MGRARDSEAAPRTPAAAEAEEPGFEASLARLEALVERLEQGDLALEAALEAFEEGVTLARRCAAQLGDAERRIEVLLRQGAGSVTQPLAVSPEGEGEGEGE
jgi:exodeoxyribonuclease VII small subunit